MKWPWSKKKKPMRKRSFQGARYDRTTADFIAMGTSADSEIKGSLPALRARSRQLERDNDYAKGAFRDVTNNVIGKGVRLQPRFTKQRGGELNEELNLETFKCWTRWCRKQFCHTGGTLSFKAMERLGMHSIARDGEMFFRHVYQSFGGSKIPYALETIESDQIDDNYSGIAPNGNAVRMGVEFDKWQRPVAFWILKRHPGDYQFGVLDISLRGRDRLRVPSEDIVHMFITDRAGQSRGIPWLHAAILRLNHMGRYEEAELIGARTAASLMGFIQTAEGQFYTDDAATTDATGQRVTDFEPGVFKQMNPGETVNVPNLSRPGDKFDPFMRLMLRGVAISIGTTYESLSGDYSQVNYSSARQALLSVRDNFEVVQDWFIENFHQVVFEKFLDMATLSGALVLPKFEVAPEMYYESVKWQPRGWNWIDPEKEVAAAERAVQAGFRTQESVISDLGDDYEDVMTQREKEVKKAKEYGLNLTIDNPKDVQPKGPGKPDQQPSKSPKNAAS